MTLSLLHADDAAGPRPPARIVHLGLGAFSRSHLAWYTDRCDDARDWGISAYTGRSSELARALSAQHGRYTLIERGEHADAARVIGSIVRATPGDDVSSFVADVASPDTAIVSLTITERGYRIGTGGTHDLRDPAVAADDGILRGVIEGRGAPDSAQPTTALGRLMLGLIARRAQGSPPLAVLSLDNLPDNGEALRRVVTGWARSLDASFAGWLDESATFPSSSVDRITPRLSDAELTALQDDYGDRAPVVAETFSDWVVSGAFPGGRPSWETAGVRFVDDLGPWESRKLWMLNGAHTLLACLGLVHGHASVQEAISDPVCRSAVEAWWEEAGRQLPASLDPAEYAQRLLERFSHSRIEHRLDQIAADSPLKLAVRVAPVAERERRAGRSASAAATAIAAWIAADREGLLGPARQNTDGSQAALAAAIRSISPQLADDADFVAAVGSASATMTRVPT